MIHRKHVFSVWIFLASYGLSVAYVWIFLVFSVFPVFHVCFLCMFSIFNGDDDQSVILPSNSAGRILLVKICHIFIFWLPQNMDLWHILSRCGQKLNFELIYRMTKTFLLYSETETEVMVHKKERTFHIENLESDEKYKVWMMSASPTGEVSESTEPIVEAVEFTGIC